MARHARGAALSAAPPPHAIESLSARERILAAAMHLVQTEGLQALSQGRAAVAAGLRQSHLTYYFPTRKDLIKALAEAIHAQMLQSMNAPFVEGESPEPLKDLREFFAAQPRNPLLGRLMLSLVEAADEDPSVRNWLENFQENARAHLRELFANLGVECSEDDLDLFHAAIVGSCIRALHGSPAAVARSSHLVRLAFDRLIDASPSRRRSKARSARRLSSRK